MHSPVNVYRIVHCYQPIFNLRLSSRLRPRDTLDLLTTINVTDIVFIMFSGFRSLVEELAGPEPRRVPQESSTTDRAVSRSGSLDSAGTQTLSSSQLADSALSNLRKSLAIQRSGSPSRSKSPEQGAVLPKSNLEERLRAKFAIGDASNGTTPSASARASPAPPAAAIDHPLSPRLTPLPESPLQSPAVEVDVPAVFALNISPDIHAPKPSPQVPAAPPATELGHTAPSAVTGPGKEAVESKQVGSSEPSAPSEEAPKGHSVLEPLPIDSPSDGANVDTLQQRLKLVEQRFAGKSRFPLRCA